jgi:hypothetical protein
VRTVDGRLYVVGGASRSGKTAGTRKATKGSKRIFAWDPEDQWAQLAGWKRVTSRAELLAAAQKPGNQKIAYVAGGDLAAEFDYWAGCVMYAGRYVGPLDAIAEELADVTKPSKAPGNWGILLRRGLKRGITIYALSQRWQEADKTAMGNASCFVLFRQNGPKAAKYLESMTGVPFQEIPVEPLYYVIFDPTTGKVEKGKLRF